MKGFYAGVFMGLIMWGCFAALLKICLNPAMSWLWAVIPFGVSGIMVILPVSVLVYRSWKYAYTEQKLNEARRKDRENAIAEVERKYSKQKP